MPSANPKHKKKRISPTKMGLKKQGETCFLENCTQMATHHISFRNITEYANKLKWNIDSKKKVKSVGLCKKHYKEYKKLKDKDSKYAPERNFNPKNTPKPQKHQISNFY